MLSLSEQALNRTKNIQPLRFPFEYHDTGGARSQNGPDQHRGQRGRDFLITSTVNTRSGLKPGACNIQRQVPIRISSPEPSSVSITGSPLSNVPLMESRSFNNSALPSIRHISACRGDTRGSSICTSQSDDDPSTIDSPNGNDWLITLPEVPLSL